MSLLLNAPVTNELLSVLGGFTHPTPLPTRELRMDAVAMLGEGLAQTLVAALPNLQSLTLELGYRSAHSNEELKGLLGDQSELAAGLAYLACPRVGLQRLTRLELRLPYGLALQPSLSAALSGATQLTQLSLPLEVSTLEAVAPLSSLRSLHSLDLASCAPHLLAPLLSPLTALTSLKLGSTAVDLLAIPLAVLPSLAVLRASGSSLSVSALAQLSSLTELAVWSLALSSEEQQALQLTPQRCDWRLPPKLARIQIDVQAPEILSAISRSSPIRQLEWVIMLEFEHGLHFDPDLGALTEYGEGALIGAFQTLAGRMAEGSSVVIMGSHTLLPVGGEAEVGPGRRNHTPWLEAVARSGVPELVLNCDAVLTRQDLATLASSVGLKTLELHGADLRPFAGLMALSGSARLERLVVDTELWFAGEWHDGPFEPPSAAEGVILALLLACPRLSVALTFRQDSGLSAEAQEGLDDMFRRMQTDLEAMGCDPKRLLWAD